MDGLPDSPVMVSVQALHRMPYYLQYLKEQQKAGVTVIAAPAAAASLDLNEVQVRKDFAAVSKTRGRPKAGFAIAELIFNIEELLGYHNVHDAVLVGAGSLGSALLCYRGFDDCGMHIVAAFDADASLAGTEIGGKKVLPADQLIEMCQRLNIHIGIIAVPVGQAQAVCDQLVAGGVLAIWNFAPVHLSTPGEILVQNENMAASLALLSQHLQEKMKI